MVAVAVEALVMIGGGGLTVRVRVIVPVPPAFVALNEALDVLAAVGVPEIRPVPVSTDKPTGSPAALKLVGLLVAVI